METMTTLIDFLKSTGCKQYREARRLSEEQSKHDLETEPYKSKYKARDVLIELRRSLNAYFEETEPESTPVLDLLACQSLLEYQLATNYIDTDEMSTGEEHLKRVEEILTNFTLNYKCVSILLNTFNQKAILWNSRHENQQALDILLQAQELYSNYKHEVDKAPLYVHELLDKDCEEMSDHDRWQEFEKLYTHTLYYLAQVYGALQENHKSASYCHTTLQRQLNYEQYEPLEWALNCATLSQYYITQSNYPQARHCLASAYHIFVLNKEKYTPKDDEEDEERRKEDIANRQADLCRCWTKYCISLLEDSKEKLDVEGSTEAVNEQAGRINQEETGDAAKLHPRFESLELTSLEEQVTDKLVAVFNEARNVFVAGQKWIAESKQFYKIDGYVSEHIEIIKDHSVLFKLLSFFETDLDRKCKMHKRRVDMIQSVLKELNPQHFLLVCRQLIFESAEIYSAMVDLKISIAEQTNSPSQHAVKKINLLIMHSIEQYQAFLDSLRKPDGIMPDTLEEDVVRPTMVAHFCMGRLYSKIVCDSRIKLDNIQKSINHYKFVVDYCKSHPEIKSKVTAELEICKDMVELLPLRMKRLEDLN